MFLIRKKGAKSRAHIWNGTDTVCAMWSSGGLKRSRYELKETTNGHGICKTCNDLSQRKPDRLIPKQSQEVNKPIFDSRQNWSQNQWREYMETEEWLQEYRKIRYQTFLRYGKICMVCSTKGTEENPIQADHIAPKSLFPELSLDPDNMQIMCKDCNYGKGNRDRIDWRPPNQETREITQIIAFKASGTVEDFAHFEKNREVWAGRVLEYAKSILPP